MLARNLCIFSRPDIDQLKFYFDIYHPDKLLTLPLLASEIIYIAFNSSVDCPDERCDKYLKKLEKLNMSGEKEDLQVKMTFINKFHCYFCKKKKIKFDDSNQLSPKSFVLLDLRIEETSNTGFLPGTVILDRDDFLDSNVKNYFTTVCRKTD
jgi:hypothetical protein